MKWYLVIPVALLTSLSAHAWQGIYPSYSNAELIKNQLAVPFANEAIHKASLNFKEDFPRIAKEKAYRTPAVERFFRDIMPIYFKPFFTASFTSSMAFYEDATPKDGTPIQKPSVVPQINYVLTDTAPCTFPNGEKGPVTVRTDLQGAPICFDLQYIAKFIDTKNVVAVGNSLLAFGLALRFGMTPQEAHQVARFVAHHLQKRPF